MAYQLTTVLLVAMLALAGCATTSDGPPETPLSYVKIFSSNAPSDEALPDGWHRWTLSKFKKPTHYELVSDNGRTVIKAHANASASGLIHRLNIDPREFPMLSWQWKTTALIKTADNRTKHREDSPVRVAITFAGNMDKLSFNDRIFFDNIRALTGQPLPYATLIYIWENRVASDTVLPNLHTTRIKMIVAESGREKIGLWQDKTRNVYDDYRRAFGEAPGTITSVAVMTDTDNTGEDVHAYYGDIVFKRGAQPATATQR
jgi:hypothetical protein